jgi:hypothetical protein
LRTLLQKQKTEAKVQDALVSGLDAWLDNRTNTFSWDPQKDIGWEQCFMGFLSCEWGHKQAQHFQSIGDRDSNAQVWGMKLIQYMWEQGKRVWKQRNDKVHSKEDPDARNQQRKEIEAKVRNLYNYADQLSATDRDLLARPLEERLRSKTHDLETWYEETHALIRECVREFLNRQAEGTRDIRTFFNKPPG